MPTMPPRLWRRESFDALPCQIRIHDDSHKRRKRRYLACMPAGSRAANEVTTTPLNDTGTHSGGPEPANFMAARPEPADVAAIVDDLEALGVELWAQEGSLRYRAPHGVLTSQRLDLMRSQKAELITYLLSAGDIPVVADPDAGHQPFPLTDIQAAYLIGRRPAVAYGGVGCHAYGELSFPELDADRVAVVWQQLVERHDMLRAVIDPRGSQRVLPRTPPVSVDRLDLRGRGAQEVEAALAAVRAELDHRVYPTDQWPLFEVRVTTTGTAALLHLSIDFLIADFVSIQTLLAEFEQLYRSPHAPLPAIDISFRDYMVAAQGLRRTRRYERDRQYWWDRLDALPSAPDLPLTGEGPTARTPRFRRYTGYLSPAQYRCLKGRSADHDVTASGALLAAYAEVIGRWSRHSRFLLNLTLLSRPALHPHVGRLVGDFTSAVLLQVDAADEAAFAERARRLQKQLWVDLDHRLISGVEVMRELARRRGPPAALMPVVFTSALGLGDNTGTAAIEEGYGVSQTPQVWIDCQIMERGESLRFNWDLREGVFPPGMAQDMFDAFALLVSGLATDEGLWAEQQPVPLPVSQQARHDRFNDSAVPLPEDLLHTEVVAQCLRTPERTAVATSGRILSYRELLRYASAVAHSLTEAGCMPGDVVAVIMDTGWEQIVAVIGVLLAGGAYLPIDTRQPQPRRNTMLSQAGARYALVTSGGSRPAQLACIAVDELAPATDGVAAVPRSPDDIAYIMFTSGSAGRPKGVAITHRGAVNTVRDISRRFSVGPGDRVLGLASLAFDLSVYDIFGPLAVGGAIVLPDHSRRGDPSHWADLARDHEVTVWNSVPAQLQMLSDYLGLEADIQLPKLRLGLLSGDWIPVGLPDQVRGRIKDIELVSLGGATEASIWSIYYPIGEVDPGWASIPYGRPLANQTFQVLDERGRCCPDWAVGELYIGGLGLAVGYVGDAEQTRRRFAVDDSGRRRYRTGDLGRYLPDGLIEFLGREDLQVKIRGYRIELAEIETALQAHPAVAAAAVVIEGDEPLERRLAAFAETSSRVGAAESPGLVADVTAAARKSLAATRAEMDSEHAIAFARQLDRTALLAMAAALRGQGLFATPAAAHLPDEVMAVAGVASQHRRLIRRWLKALEDNGMLSRDERTGHLANLAAVTPAQVQDAWRQVYQLQPDGGQRSELVEYFRIASEHLAELMQAKIDPVRLLFPEGRPDIQESAYQGNFLSVMLNRLVVAATGEIAKHHAGGPLRVLEVGAGVGGASDGLIAALDSCQAEYLFTDVSNFFINRARERFAVHSWVDYGRYDLNEGYREQGLAGNTFDVIVCANVLHYARHAGRALDRFRELLRPGGWLVFIETMRDNYQILTSMEFLFDGDAGEFEDVRAGRDQTFIALEEWRDLLAGAAASSVIWLSAGDKALQKIGMHAFAVQFKGDRTAVTPEVLRQHLQGQLPDYMIPARLELVDALPLTENGKVDRRALGRLLPTSPTASRASAAAPVGDVEVALARIFAEVLGMDRVGRDQGIFELGGDSLLAAQLAGRIRDEVGEAAGASFDSLLGDVLEGSTVANLAAGLAQSVSEPGIEAGHNALVIVTDGEADTVQLLIHDATGGIDTALTWMRSGSLVLGTVPDEADYLGVDSGVLIGRQAAHYASLVTAQTDRPVSVLGVDFGGLLAVEVARYLAEAGIPVADVTVVLSAPYPHSDGGQADREVFARSVGKAAPAVTPPGSPDAAADQPEDELWLAQLSAALGLETGQLRSRHQMYLHSIRAQEGHRVTSYAGDITLLIAFDPGGWPHQAPGVEEFWREVCLGELHVVHAAGVVARPPVAGR
jgi:pyochelin synthetase